MFDQSVTTQNLNELLAIQAKAIAEGRQAEREGKPVIYIHGRPYADPANEASS